MGDFFSTSSAELIWFVVGLIMLLLELVLPGLIIAFFGIGAWLVALFCWIFPRMSVNWQLLIFMVTSIGLLVLLRKRMAKIFTGKTSDDNTEGVDVEDFLDQKARVIETIRPGAEGKIEFHGTEWRAEADEEIAAGTAVRIIAQKSTILKVTAISKEV